MRICKHCNKAIMYEPQWCSAIVGKYCEIDPAKAKFVNLNELDDRVDRLQKEIMHLKDKVNTLEASKQFLREEHGELLSMLLKLKFDLVDWKKKVSYLQDKVNRDGNG